MEKFYTTETGYRIEFMGIAPLIDKLRADSSKNLPPVPTYETETALGAKETHAHFQRFVQAPELDPNTNDPTGKTILKEENSFDAPDTPKGIAERAAWADYESALLTLNTAYAEKFTKLAILKGVKILEPAIPSDEEWVPMQEFIGITVPTEPLERKWHWMQTELLATPDEAKHLLMGVLSASGTDEEVISEMEKSFRDSVGGTSRHAADGVGDSDRR